MADKNTIRYMLVDGHALIHRGFHALPGLTVTKTGEPIGAVYGFTMILLRAIKDLKPTHIACCFDLDGKTFRHEQYEEYKAHRVKQPDELYAQIPKVREVVSALNIAIFEKAGFEADDCLGTLAVKLSAKSYQLKASYEIMIVTGDMDTLQLVNEHVKIYTLKKGLTDIAVYDIEAIRERYGLLPAQMIDYKALRGDPSDNIKGVKGIGEKTAAELIKEFGNIENLYGEIHDFVSLRGESLRTTKQSFENSKGLLRSQSVARNDRVAKVDTIKPRVLQLLIDGEESARQSYDLSTIRTNVDIEVDVPPYLFGQEQLPVVVNLFKKFEFRSLIDKLPKGYDNKVSNSEFSISKVKKQGDDSLAVNPAQAGIQEAGNVASGFENPRSRVKHGMTEEGIGKQEYNLVDSEEKLEKLIKQLKKQSSFVLDTESTSLNIIDAKPVGVSLSFETGVAYYIPSKLVEGSQELRDILQNPEIKKCGHNIKYDLHILKNSGIHLAGISFDSMLASYLLNSSTRQHGLDALAFNELGYQMQPITDLIGTGKNQITMDQVEVEKVSWYACEDADITRRLCEIFEARIKEDDGLAKIFSDIEIPLIQVLSEMEREGIEVDVDLLQQLSSEAEKSIYALQKEIHKLTGEEFNISSPKQLKEVLFDKLHLSSEGNKKTKTGLSTAAGELEKLVGQHPVIEKILEYREVTKLQSTYLLALPELVNKSTGRIHTSYNQTIAATGRLSSTDPNLQNIPVGESGLAGEVRKAFVAKRGFKLLSIDYSQMELRIVAHLSHDKNMMEAFRRGDDIHTTTAMGIFGVEADKVTKEMRRHAKTVNFGILYGLSAFGLSSRVGEIAHGDAKEYIEKYFAAYPGVKDYLEQVKEEVRANECVRNELGRVRRFPEIRSSQFFIRQAAERAAINFPIQSLQADIIKIAMLNIYEKLVTRLSAEAAAKEGSSQLATDCKMLLQVHDELVFEVKEDKVEHYASMLTPLMTDAYKLSVPVLCEAKAGDNWGEMVRVNF